MEKFKIFLAAVVRIFLLYVFVLLVSAIVAPIVSILLQKFGFSFAFGKVFDRVRYVGLALMLPLLWRWAGVKRWHDFGWGRLQVAVILMILGALSTFIIILLNIGLMSFFHLFSTLQIDSLSLAKLVLKAITIGFVVSLIEEFVFRGLLQKMLVKSSGVIIGIFLSAIIFAWLHGRAFSLDLTPSDGFTLAVRYLSEWPDKFPAMMFLNLSILGAILGFLYVCSGSLLWPIAFHTGIVFIAATLSPILKSSGVSLPQIIADYRTSIVLFAWLIFAAVATAMSASLEKKKPAKS
jgi:membrane protease YdiL (CAAX protease family)